MLERLRMGLAGAAGIPTRWGTAPLLSRVLLVYFLPPHGFCWAAKENPTDCQWKRSKWILGSVA